MVAEIDIPGVVPTGLPSLGQVGKQQGGLVQRIGIGGDPPRLPVGVHPLAVGAAERLDRPDALRLLAALPGIDPYQFARLETVVTRRDREEDRAFRHHPRMNQCGREPGVIAIERLLSRPVQRHLEKRLGIDLRTVIVLPTGIEDPFVPGDCREIVMYLVKGDAGDVRTIRVAPVDVAHLGPPAIDNLHTPGRIEEDRTIGKVAPLVIGDSRAEGQLGHLARRQIHLIQMEIVLPVMGTVGEKQPRPVGRDIHIADASLFRLEEHRLVPKPLRRRLHQTERAGALDVNPFGLRVGQTLGIGVVRPAHHIVAGIDPLGHLLRHTGQTFRAAADTHLPVSRQTVRQRRAGIGLHPDPFKGGGEPLLHLFIQKVLPWRQPGILGEPVGEQRLLPLEARPNHVGVQIALFLGQRPSQQHLRNGNPLRRHRRDRQDTERHPHYPNPFHLFSSLPRTWPDPPTRTPPLKH